MTAAKDETKLIPHTMFKGAKFDGIREYRHRDPLHDLLHRLDDNNDNWFLPENVIYLTHSATENYNCALAK